MTNRNLSIDGEDFDLNFNPMFKPDFKTLDIESIFKNKTTRSIAVGVLDEVEGVIGRLQTNYANMTDPDKIQKLSDRDRVVYEKYLKLISQRILQSTVSDLLKAFDNPDVRRRVFKKFPKGGILQNKSLEKYLKDNDILIQDMSINFLKDASATREQQLSLTEDGTRLTRILLKPNKQNITKPSALIDMSMINDSKFLSVRGEQDITITFDSLQYMKELFENYDYDKPFDFQEDTEKIKGALGRFPSDDENLQGIPIPSNRIILTSIPKDKKIKNSYIDGEGLDEKTTITSRIQRQPRDSKEDIPAYNYITISPSFDESSASKKERDFTITYVHRNENSIVKVTDNSESEDLMKGSSEELLMFAQAYKPEDTPVPIYDLYVNDGNASPDSPVVRDLTFNEFKKTVPDKDWIKKYEYTGKNNPIDRIIASSLTPRVKRMTEAGIVYDVYLPLGLVEIVVKSNADGVIRVSKKRSGKTPKSLQDRMIQALTNDDIIEKLEDMIKEYAKYADVIIAFDESRRNTEGLDEFVERVLGEGGEDVPLRPKEVTGSPTFAEDPIYETVSGERRYKGPSPTAGMGTTYVKTKGSLTEKYVDLEEMYSGSSKGLLTSRDFYLAMLKLARDKVDAKTLMSSISQATAADNDAVKMLIGLIPEAKRESEFASSTRYLTRDEEDKKRVSAYFDKGTGKIPILKLKSATAKYKKQLLLSGSAGLSGVGGRTEIKNDLNTAKRVVRGIKSYRKSINRAVEG